MAKQGKREYVTFKSVRLPLYKHPNGWRFSYPDESVKGGWRYGTRTTKQAAKEAAHTKAVEIASGLLDLSNLPPDQARLARAFLDLKPTWKDIENLKSSRSTLLTPIGDIIEKFHQFKLTEKGTLTKHLATLLRHINRLSEHLGNPPISTIKSEDIQQWLDSLTGGVKNKNDHRNSVIALYLFAEKLDLIAKQGNFNEAQKTIRLKESTTVIATYTPKECIKLLKNVEPPFLPWLAIVMFSGIRTGELWSSDKQSLTWDCVKLDRDIIEIPASHSKNRKRKLIPILPNLKEWLNYIGIEDKPSGEAIIPSSPNQREVVKLGKVIGGWKKNALRHSYGSYRVAVTQSIGQVALEMDNSEAIIKKHYLEAMPKEKGRDYFRITPLSIGLVSD